MEEGCWYSVVAFGIEVASGIIVAVFVPDDVDAVGMFEGL